MPRPGSSCTSRTTRTSFRSACTGCARTRSWSPWTVSNTSPTGGSTSNAAEWSGFAEFRGIGGAGSDYKLGNCERLAHLCQYDELGSQHVGGAIAQQADARAQDRVLAPVVGEQPVAVVFGVVLDGQHRLGVVEIDAA